jgi:spermidine synthase
VYEVVWTRAISLVLGSTVYAISTMLATFMAGLAIGSFFGGRLSDRRNDHLFLFALCELSIGVCGMVSVPLINLMPGLYLTIYRTFHLQPQLFFLLQASLCAMVMLIPTILMGATFPIVSRQVTRGLEQMGSGVGIAYFVNTVGAVAGSVLSGFVLIPIVGVKGTTFTAAMLNLVAGVGLLLLTRKPARAVVAFVPAFLLGGVLLAEAEPHSTIVSFYSARRYAKDNEPFREIAAADRKLYRELYRSENAEGTVKAFRYVDGSLVLQVGGKIEGTSRDDLANTVLLAYLPLASHVSAHSFLTIGLGAGVTLGAARDHLRDVDLVEINPGVVEAIRRHGAPGLLDNLTVIRNDARNYLLATDKRYDIISSEPSYPTESAVANLFTRDFYEIAARRLNEGGIYCQWLPYYVLANDDVTMMLKTFASVFPNTWLWKVTNSLDLIMIGSTSPGSFSADEVAARVRRLNVHNYPLDFQLSRTPEQVREIAAGNDVPVNTDDRPLLEYAVVGNMLRGKVDR